MKVIVLVLSLFLTFSLVLPVCADDQGDDASLGVNQWLRQEKLSLTKTVPQAFSDKCVIVEGEGFPSREAATALAKKLTAERAAEVTAYRKLAEFLDGVTVTAETTTRNFTLTNDQVRLAVNGFVKGAQVVYKEYREKEEIAFVLLKVGMNGPASFGEVMYRNIMNSPNIGAILPAGQRAGESVKAAKLDDRYDGLVIDATDLSFRPALINRVYAAKGEILYDPSKITQKVLIECGCGEYSNSVEKAKDALVRRGCKNPLVVRATGTVNPSDLEISPEDAGKVISANSKTNFFSQAKVAFVVK